jgi:N-acetyl-alpha-D-muramate 1-phosphate uridylyltransferase
MKAMIFAAGLGTRLHPITQDIPKALVPVGGKALLERNLLYLQKFGIFDVMINVHHFADRIEDFLRENNNFGSNVTISDERAQLLETGGGLLKAAPFFSGEPAFVVLNADILTNLNLFRVLESQQSHGCIGVLAVMQRSSSRQLLFDSQMRLCGWHNSATGASKIARSSTNTTPFSFSGVSVLQPAILENLPFSGKFSLIDIFLHQAKTAEILGLDHTGDLLTDVGKPENIILAEKLFP